MFNLRLLWIKWKWRQARKTAKERIELREYVRKRLSTPMSNEEVKQYNLRLCV